jgi:hypothetical protein
MKFTIHAPVTEFDLTESQEPYNATPELPALITPIRPRTTIARDIQEIFLEEVKKDGFREGAVVVHTRVALKDRIDPINWGFVFFITTHPNPQMPIKVKWLNGSWEDCNPIHLRVMLYPQEKGILQARASRNEV